MNSQYFSRIYFSRYFYSSFKSTLKARIKITRKNDEIYFYSDPYYFNYKQKGFSTRDFVATPINSLAPTRSYYFPLYFTFPHLSGRYDLGWQNVIGDSAYFIKFFSLFLKMKFFSLSSVSFTKIYFNFFLKSKKLW